MQSQSWMTTMAVICVLLMQICRAVGSSSKDEDKVLSLPGQPKVSFQQYAGYITISKREKRALFYYFVEAEREPASKPLVLWLNGGPGCSSVGAGAFSEHGPFRPTGEGNLIRNEYSWNKVANIIYLESPAGVGFSYSANASFYDSVNDTITAQDNFIFLQKWFLKFPEYKRREFFIAGESYAGHYVPQLAKLIVQSGLQFVLKGIAIGNPLLDFSIDSNARGDYYWSHGLISDSTHQLLTSVCNASQLLREATITGSLSPVCAAVAVQFTKELSDSINGYDVTADVCVPEGNSKLKLHNNLLRPDFLFSLSSQLLQKEPNHHAKAPENIDVCVEAKAFEYLNKKEVQEALHAKLVGVASWTECSEVLEYDRKNLEIPMIDVVGSLITSGIRVTVYSGDQDSVVPFTGTRTLVNGLAKKRRLNTTTTYRVWFEDRQVGGWTQVYGEILTFATIRGGSHLSPISSPKRSLALFKAFLSGDPLS